MSLLIYKKPAKTLGINEGYYFKGEFLSRYQQEALQILRERVEKAGSKIGDMSKTNFEKGMKVLPDEYQVIREAYEKMQQRTKSTEAKKQPYYNQIHKRVLAHSLITLKGKIELRERKKQELIKDFDNKIQELKLQVEEIERRLQ